MRIAITGATGFIGGLLAQRLWREGHDVVALVRNPAAAPELEREGITVIKGDIGDAAAVAELVAGADQLFHVAGWYKLGGDPAQAWATNVDGTRNVLLAAQHAGVARVVYTSTVAINSDTGGAERDETFEFTGKHLSVYDQTKAAAHRIAQDFAAHGLPLVIVMPSSVYGPNDTSQVGNTLKQVLAGHRAPAPAGLEMCAAYIDDIIDGHLLAMEKGRVGESYILAGPRVYFVDFLRQAAAIEGRPGPVSIPKGLVKASAVAMRAFERIPGVPGEYSAESFRAMNAHYVATSAKAERELGWSSRSIADGLAQTVQVCRATGCWPMPPV